MGKSTTLWYNISKFIFLLNVSESDKPGSVSIWRWSFISLYDYSLSLATYPDGRMQRTYFHLYLVLLPVGFTLPMMLPPMRCALTTPFHPYQIGGIFSVALSLGLPLLEVIQHLISIEPGLSSLKSNYIALWQN